MIHQQRLIIQLCFYKLLKSSFLLLSRERLLSECLDSLSIPDENPPLRSACSLLLPLSALDCVETGLDGGH
ncbi:hypothetical protein FGO68_gene3747 [Halteria grandinella]|uniref:Uncharacterized protein n=1 Tax=Halteria grandinella TaxID=5974 RepID=A0A8J8STR5_HALGN|nr:hypothetical protein FGO68_gene3747 [Halteria grandinella]